MGPRSVFAATILLVPTFAHAEHERLTNADVIQLGRAGLSEEVILAKIAASEADFDTSTDAILELKRNKLSDKVIAAMIVREAGRPVDESGPLPPYAALGSPLSVALAAGETTHRLEGTVPRDRYVNAVVALLWFKRLKGETAAVRVSEKKPTLTLPRSVGGVATNLSGVYLVKLDVDHDEEAREYRLDWGTPFTFVVDMVPEDDYLVEYNATEDGDRILITPEQPLKRGEYALVDERHFVYDFAIE